MDADRRLDLARWARHRMEHANGAGVDGERPTDAEIVALCADADRAERMGAALREIVDALDEGLGDSDLPIGPDVDEEDLREEDPVLWACRKAVAALRESAGSRGDGGEGE